MTQSTFPRRFFPTPGIVLTAGLLMAALGQNVLAAPDDSARAPSADAATTPSTAAKPAAPDRFWDALDAQPQDAWTRLRDSFGWDIESLSPEARARVDKWIARYRESPRNIRHITRDAKPWLAWITRQVEERNLPGEVALLPFIESSFDPGARNYSGAAGLWQFMPRTGDALGLARNRRYDGRLDVDASTRAALGYIESQAERWYGGDIPLSLAAYNAGAGTVNKARRRAERQGRGNDYWSLSLPGETMQYLPKLYAIAEIIAHPQRYGVELPDIQVTPAVARVELHRSTTLNNLARRLDVSQPRLAKLNPGVLRGAVDPADSTTLLVPHGAHRQALVSLSIKNAEASSSGSDSASGSDGKTKTETPKATHRVKSGDNLTRIASRHNVSTRDLIRWNAIESPGSLRPGQLLSLSGG